MKIKCWSCRRVVAETTDKYDPDRVLNGSMIRLAEPYRSRGWGLDMNWNVGTGRAELFCPECAYPLAPTKGLDFVYKTDDAPVAAGGIICSEKFNPPITCTQDVEIETAIECKEGAPVISKSIIKRIKARTVEGKELIDNGVNHTMTIQFKAEPEHVCDICGKAAKNAAGLANHKRMAHPEIKND